MGGCVLLKMGEEIRIVAESETASASFRIEECGSTRILLIADSTEYYVVVNGQRVHWKEYQSIETLEPPDVRASKAAKTERTRYLFVSRLINISLFNRQKAELRPIIRDQLPLRRRR